MPLSLDLNFDFFLLLLYIFHIFLWRDAGVHIFLYSISYKKKQNKIQNDEGKIYLTTTMTTNKRHCQWMVFAVVDDE